MTVLMDVDPSVMVDSLFGQLQCCSRRADSHRGDRVAYLDWHGCYAGVLCAGHYQHFLNVRIPEWNVMLQSGPILCLGCMGKFRSREELCKVVIL